MADKTTTKSMGFCLSLLICFMNIHLGSGAFGFGGEDKVLLSEVETLTLYNGRMTNSRRSGPIPQLKCEGGSAGCGTFVPQVVQCTNKGSDGRDIQWECKTDMDNTYRFGRVEVSCEGFDYPDDPYILRGSCGLEYTIDLTQEGQQKKNQGHHNYGSNYGGHSEDYHDRSSYQSSKSYSKARSIVGDLVLLCAIGGVVYVIYKTCIAGGQQAENRYPNQGQDNRFGGSQPPPPGFRQDYMPGGDSCSGSSYYSGGQTNYGNHARPGNTGGGFWTGAATGGLLGYMFGNRGNNHYGSRTYTPYTGSSFWGQPRTQHRSSAFSGGSSFSFGGGGSSGTRTASGFGGTKRR
ncbi:store-operated calcium entry-associated regulatory factor-like [Mizuhopecten yessoensis]|uniref:Store-operated calcium entry-associated regulatory factor n=1 Tax=Mizuhopecten yessoensis TaxID=6573 RepID=A0A210PGI7_MIZYE|nr:store-operated calcium entry-associated regulatory factor-like [Mizuhopecten yessoensis]OWF35556.1 Store-operated calcium entry-associated regulatory factor [Mizuhopecten yessoensis]